MLASRSAVVSRAAARPVPFQARSRRTVSVSVGAGLIWCHLRVSGVANERPSDGAIAHTYIKRLLCISEPLSSGARGSL
jgi:hypothetical protein